MGERTTLRTVGAGLAVVGLALALAGGIALAADITCERFECRGTQQDDVITGRNRIDNIAARGGNDEVRAGNGFDFVRGGTGDGQLHAEAARAREAFRARLESERQRGR